MRTLALFLLVACPLPSTASPATVSASSISNSHDTSSRTTTSLRWLSNALISRVWPLHRSHGCNHQHPSGSRNKGNAEIQAQNYGGVAAPALYNQDIVLRFNISTVEEARAIAEAADDFSLDIWAYSGDWVDIRLAKDFLPSLLTILPSSLSQSYAPLIPESTFKSLVSLPQNPSGSDSSSSSAFSRHSSLQLSASSNKDLFFNDYQPLPVIHPWLRLLSSMFPDHSRLVTLGTSYQGREILGLRVGRPSPPIEDPGNDPDAPAVPPRRPRKTILITGGAHAREWISVAAVNYIAHQLITTYDNPSSVSKRLVDGFDWILVPTLNPDGYEHSWNADRLWRKNRQPTSLRFCSGIDLDRGFGYRFDEDAAGRMSPCSEAWAGDHAWEAHEATRVREWVGNLTSSDMGGDELIAFLDLHSYSQQVLYPYAYSCDESPPTLENLEELAMGLARAMGRAGGNKGWGYKVAQACEGNVVTNDKGKTQRLPNLESGGGSPLDWFYHEVGVRYAFQIKLRDTGSYGFLLPREEIVPQGKEVFAAVSHLGRFLLGEIGMLDVDESHVNEEELIKSSQELLGKERPDPVSDNEDFQPNEEDDDSIWDEENRLLSRLEFRARKRR